MNCPTHGTPLTRIGNNSYACHRCTTPWCIYPDTSVNFRFNRNAPFASLVLEIDALTGEKVRRPHAESDAA